MLCNNFYVSVAGRVGRGLFVSFSDLGFWGIF